jgi:hypothetical protein
MISLLNEARAPHESAILEVKCGPLFSRRGSLLLYIKPSWPRESGPVVMLGARRPGTPECRQEADGLPQPLPLRLRRLLHRHHRWLQQGPARRGPRLRTLDRSPRPTSGRMVGRGGSPS